MRMDDLGVPLFLETPIYSSCETRKIRVNLGLPPVQKISDILRFFQVDHGLISLAIVSYLNLSDLFRKLSPQWMSILIQFDTTSGMIGCPMGF